MVSFIVFYCFSSRGRHRRYIGDWSSDVCSSDLLSGQGQEGRSAVIDFEIDTNPAHAAVTAVGEEPLIVGLGVSRGNRCDLDDQRAVVGQQARAARGRADRRE